MCFDMQKFCFVCGKKTSNLIKGYCESCYNKKILLVKLPKKISFKECKRCNDIKFKGKWQKLNIEKIIKGKVKVSGKIRKMKLTEMDNKIEVTFFIEPSDSRKIKKETFIVEIQINKTTCGLCSRKAGGYHEAIIQLRGFPENVINFVDMYMEKFKKKKTFYFLEKVKNGFDIKLENKLVARNLSKKIQEKFDCKVKESFKLVTRKRGKDVYKLIILILYDRYAKR